MNQIRIPLLPVLVLVLCIAVLPGSCVFADENAGDTLTRAAMEQRSRLEYKEGTFSGPAWSRLVADARDSLVFLIGEEHGIAENPKLAAQLFTELVPSGYRNLVIEISPPMARTVDAALLEGGMDGLLSLFAQPGGEPAFFGMQEEAELLVSARAAVPGGGEVLWGVDYEVAADRTLLRALQAAPRPDSAEEPLATLIAASDASWQKYETTRNPGFIFSFSGDPALVAALRTAWPGADGSVLEILDTLETTLEINRLWVSGNGFASNELRARNLRTNLLKHWRASGLSEGQAPRVMVKLGASHVIRGRNSNGVFDIGTLAPELASLAGGRATSMLVLPGRDAMTAVLNPSSWTFEAKPAKDGYARGIESLTDAAYEDGFTLIDLRPLRQVVGNREKAFGSRMLQIVHGFDLLLVMTGSTASSQVSLPAR